MYKVMDVETSPRDKANVRIRFECDFCNQSHYLEVKRSQFFLYAVMGHKVQDAFPELSPENREKFLTGMCSDCNIRIFGGFENE